METSHNLLPVVPNETAPSTDIPKLLKVLNPANVSSIAASMILLSSLDSTKYHLKITVARIGNKAITEPHLAAACADLCAKLSEHMKTKESPGRALRFNTAVVRWAKEYWQDVDRELYALEGRKRENGGSAASWVRIKLESVRQRYLACSRFIAHLFVNGYFTDRSIDVTYFLKKVLPVTMEDVSEGRIECLCAMLPICGPYIRDQKTVDFILNQLKKMIDAQVTSSRIRGIMEEIVNNNCLQRQTATITGGHAVHQEEGRAVETDRPLVLPGCQPLPPDGGAAVESGALMPDTDVTHPSSASETLSTSVDGQAPDYGGCPIVQPVEPGGKRKVLGLLANSLHSQTNMLWPQGGTKRPFCDAGCGMGMQGGASSSRLAETSPEDSIVVCHQAEEEEFDADAIKVITWRMLMRAANTEGEEYQEVIIGSVENIRHWTDNAKAMFVQNILEKSFESRLRDRAKYVEFVCGLARERLFSPEVLANGVGEIVAVTENIVAEVPDMYTVVVDILGSLLADKILDVAAVVIALNRSPVHTPKYYAALRQWLDAHLSAQEKEELVSRQPSVGWAMLGQPGCSVDGAAMEGVGSE